MNELTNTELTEREQVRIDTAFNNVGKSYLDCCIVVAGLDQKQEAIAKHRHISQSAVAQMAVAGKNADKFISSANNKPIDNLPEGWCSLYQMSDMTKTDINKLCSSVDKPPTRAMIKNFKTYGTVEAPEVKVVKDAEGTTEVEEAAVLVPSLELYGLSDFGKSALEKDRKKLQEAINKLPASQSKRFVELFVEVLKYHQNILLSEIRRQIPESIAVQRQKLEEKEKQLFARETQLAHGIPANEKKIVYSVLHPDKAPDGMEQKYAKAFDIVRKWR